VIKKKYFQMWVLVSLMTMSAASASGIDEIRTEMTLDEATKTFLQARVLEANQQYRDALDSFEQALKLAPDSTEVRVSYAALLLRLGMAEQAYTLVKDLEDLDWYGLRTRALASAARATASPELLPEAERALQQALEDRPDPQLQLALAQVLYSLGRLDDAEAIIADLRSKRQGDRQLLVYHASLLRRLNRLDEAQKLFAQCAADSDGPSGCRDSLIELLVERGERAAAGRQLLEWLADDDEEGLMRAAELLSDGGDLDLALQVVKKVLTIAPDDQQALSLQALLLGRMGRLDEAARNLTQLMDSDEGNLDLVLTAALIEAQRGRLDSARQLLERGSKLTRNRESSQAATRLYLTGARIELLAGRTAAVRGWLDRITDPALGGTELVRLTAAALRQEGDWEDAVAVMLRLQPRLDGIVRAEAVACEAEFLFRRGDAQARRRLQVLLSSNDITEVLLGLQVLQTLERWKELEHEAAAAVARFPDDRDLRFTWAAALERVGRVEQAQDVFSSLLEEGPFDAAVANYLGYMWADTGTNLSQALELLLRAVEAEPGNAAFIDSLGWAYFKLGNLDQAEHWLRRAVELGGDDATVMSHLGQVLLTRGVRDEARRLLRLALEQGCEHSEEVQALLNEIDKEQ